jgi:MinD superfamily P-loop ATPase
MNEIVIISGKGGTGKTSLTASFALLADNAVLADCDVDAADLHLVLSPRNSVSHEFISGHVAFIDQAKCHNCGKCYDICRFGAVNRQNNFTKNIYTIDPLACDGCKVCVHFCPVNAIEFTPRNCGKWFISDTKIGKMVHAKMSAGAENSGKLVSLIRENARKIASDQKNNLIIIDGPPGIGCPVIASITGASLVIIVTEPTLSGEHDLKRVLSLTNHFGIKTMLIVNKWDINSQMTSRIENLAGKMNVTSLGRIVYDKNVTLAQENAKAVVEIPDSPAAENIKTIWTNLLPFIKND